MLSAASAPGKIRCCGSPCNAAVESNRMVSCSSVVESSRVAFYALSVVMSLVKMVTTVKSCLVFSIPVSLYVRCSVVCHFKMEDGRI